MLPLTRQVAALIPRAAAARPLRVAIVGAGILGLCTAWALARRGHAVTVLEAGPLPNPQASSTDEGRIIRHAYGTMEGYAAMMPAGFAAWRALFAETGADRLVPCRAVYALRAESPWEAAVARTQEAAGLGFHRLDAAALDAIPVLSRDGLLRAIEVDGSGMLLARPILDDLLALLPRLGVSLRGNARVAEVAAGGVRLAEGEGVAADAVIVAAGAWAPRLLPEIAAAAGLRVSLQTLAYLAPPEDLADAWATAPMLLCRLPGHATGGVYVLPPRAGTRLKIGDYDTTAPGAPDAPPEESRRAALLDAGRIAIAGFDRHRVTNLRHCLYTMAPEDRFVLRPAGQGAWLASACSGHGFKLAPLLALGLAAALEEALAPEELAHWAAGREGEASLPRADAGS
ncbi:FAD-dependent oxidoreductase [Falsiroseomonas bella]|uniref:FAD-dependent oxidoreductase n=1 Tax=Falsiroseomonas bella TaxID=2184016 RepID=A0A317FB18_9PROT|nr:FAD-dependent oxidoreductase [Falsiroseomonas bella]PWS34698.1 FAD-dependent oxidoreductase [Falsiroseomonas bella]